MSETIKSGKVWRQIFCFLFGKGRHANSIWNILDKILSPLESWQTEVTLPPKPFNPKRFRNSARRATNAFWLSLSLMPLSAGSSLFNSLKTCFFNSAFVTPNSCFFFLLKFQVKSVEVRTERKCNNYICIKVS